MKAWRADPLVWGRGPRIFEVFLEPTCPFSVKAFGKLDDLLDQAGEDRVTVRLHLQSQPWHMYSGVIVRCILAASTLEGGKTAAKSVMAAVAAHREEFEFDRHWDARPIEGCCYQTSCGLFRRSSDWACRAAAAPA